jgi:hypothetical protein
MYEGGNMQGQGKEDFLFLPGHPVGPLCLHQKRSELLKDVLELQANVECPNGS